MKRYVIVSEETLDDLEAEVSRLIELDNRMTPAGGLVVSEQTTGTFSQALYRRY